MESEENVYNGVLEIPEEVQQRSLEDKIRTKLAD